LQRVKGYAKIDRYSDKPGFSFAVSDLATIYDGQLAAVKRGVGIVDQEYVVIRDELKTTSKPATRIRWTMLTTAEVKITGENSASLTKDGKQLLLKVVSPARISMKTWSTEPTTGYDAPNPGTILVGFECDVRANTAETLQVLLIPAGDPGKVPVFNQSLGQWK
jgi:hypothetical protein